MEPEVHHRFLEELSTGRILSQMNPVSIVASCFLKINFNIILPSIPVFPKRSLPLRFSDLNCASVSHLSHA
jgi:hypothetical protein